MEGHWNGEPRTPTATLDADTMPIPHLPPTQDQDTNITLQIASLAPSVVTGPTASNRHNLPLLTVGIPGEESLPLDVPLPPLMSYIKVTYDTEQSESGQDDVEPSSEGTVMSEAVGSDIGPEVQAAGLPKRSKLGHNPQVADAMAPEPQQTYRPWEPARVLPPIRTTSLCL